MAVTSTPAFIQAVVCSTQYIDNSTGAYTFAPNTGSLTGLVSVVAGGTNGTVVESISVTTTDTSNNVLWFVMNPNPGVLGNRVLTVVTIAAGSGTNGTLPPVDVLRGSQAPAGVYDVNGNKIIYVPNGYTLYAGVQSAVTSGKELSIQAFGGNL